MSEIKQDLLEVVQEVMIPEVEAYIEDLHTIIEKNEHSEDTLEETRDMESFLLELENIVLAINENKMNDEQAEEVYDKIMASLEKQNHEEEEA